LIIGYWFIIANMFIFILIATIFSFLQSAFVPWDLVTPLAIWILLTWPSTRSWTAVWLAGIIADIIIAQPLGISALIYLVIGLFLWLYQRKYYAFHPAFLFMFVSISLLASNWLFTQQLNFLPAIIWGVIFVLFRQTLIDYHRSDRITI